MSFLGGAILGAGVVGGEQPLVYPRRKENAMIPPPTTRPFALSPQLPRLGRRPAVLLTALIAACAISGVVAAGDADGSVGEYTLVQCHNADRTIAAAVTQQRSEYAVRNHCTEADERHSVELLNTSRSPLGHNSSILWTAPSGTEIVAARLNAKLRNHDGHRARIFVETDSAHRTGVVSGEDEPTSWRNESWIGADGRHKFGVELECTVVAGCPRSEVAQAQLRNIEITIHDSSPPTVLASGALLAGGWIRGSSELTARASDIGSGIERITASVNGTDLFERDGACDRLGATRLVTVLVPCVGQLGVTTTQDTTAAGFHDGANALRICAVDYGTPGNQGCAEHQVMVDNTAPSAAFTNSEIEDDPELIRATASDATSGLAGGAVIAYRPRGGGWRELETVQYAGGLQARVDSTREAPGDYQFRVIIGDLAGNYRTATQRQNGAEMVLHFPLKSSSDLTASLPQGRSKLLVDYRRSSEVSGRLVDQDGRPIANQPVVVTEHFDAGSVLAERVEQVATDQSGRYRSLLAAGPSRRIEVSYAGSRRYLPDSSAELDLDVRNHTVLSLSKRRARPGGLLYFRGSVGRYQAAVPGRGKLVEIQLKERGRRWGTIRTALRTDPDGRFSLPYRLGRFYTDRVNYRFRAKVASEAGWPYQGTVVSQTKRLSVVPRH